MMARACALVLAAWGFLGTPAAAEGLAPGFAALADALGLDWSARGSAWTRDRNLDGFDGVGSWSAWLRSRVTLGEHAALRLEGWVSDQAVGRGSNIRGDLREGYGRLTFDPFEIRVGREIVAWGRADRINPTDLIGSRDFTLLFPDDDDQRRGNAMVHARWGRGRTTFSLHWLPEFRPNLYPTGGVPAGVVLLGDRTPTELAQFALRLDQSGGAIDWSLSYFDGLDRDPRFALAAATPSTVSLFRRYGRIRVLGADAAAAVGGIGLRGEIAYTPSPSGAGIDSRRSGVYLVLGGDRDLVDRLNLNLQYIFRYVTGWIDPEPIADPVARGIALRNAAIANQRFRDQHAVSFRIAYRWPGDTLETEASGVFNLTGHDGLLRGRIVYKATDTLRLSVGGDWYFGPTDTYLGELRSTSGAFVELRAGF